MDAILIQLIIFHAILTFATGVPSNMSSSHGLQDMVNIFNVMLGTDANKVTGFSLTLLYPLVFLCNKKNTYGEGVLLVNLLIKFK